MPIFGPPNIEKLVAAGNVNGLYKALGYKQDPAVRQAALRGLARLGHVADALAKLHGMREAWAVAPLLAAAALEMPARSWKPEEEAYRLLAAIGTPAVEPLIGALADPDERMREAAARALGQMGEASAVEHLITVLEGQRGDLALYGDLAHVTRPLGQICARLGDANLTARAVVFLRAVFENERAGPSQRAVALQELARLGQAPVAAQLYPILDNKREARDLRLAAIEALTGPGIEQAPNTLIAILEDRAENLSLRQAAAVTLAKSSEGEGLSLLIAILEDRAEGHFLREAVLMALAERREREAISPLIALLKDDSEIHLMRCAAAEALGKSGDVKAMTALILATRGGDRMVNHCANRVLEQVGPSAVRPLIAVLSHEQRWVRDVGAKTLVRLYRTFKLDLGFMKAIMEQRDRIVQPHQDTIHRDSGSRCVGTHSDQRTAHRDSGIGVDFPLAPPR